MPKLSRRTATTGLHGGSSQTGSGFANVAFSDKENTDAMRILLLRWKKMVLRQKLRTLDGYTYF